jgi:hypothetical protein
MASLVPGGTSLSALCIRPNSALENARFEPQGLSTTSSSSFSPAMNTVLEVMALIGI